VLQKYLYINIDKFCKIYLIINIIKSNYKNSFKFPIFNKYQKRFITSPDLLNVESRTLLNFIIFLSTLQLIVMQIWEDALFFVVYVSKWVEAIANPANDSRVVSKLLKKIIFQCFGVLRALISDNGMQFIEKKLEILLKKYVV